MSEKSHVSLEQHVCAVCGVVFDTGNIPLDRRLRASLERHTTTGWGLCAEHQQLFESGYVALVEVDAQRSGARPSDRRLRQEEAYRTGRLAHLKREVFGQVFTIRITEEQPLVFVELGVIDQFQ